MVCYKKSRVGSGKVESYDYLCWGLSLLEETAYYSTSNS